MWLSKEEREAIIERELWRRQDERLARGENYCQILRRWVRPDEAVTGLATERLERLRGDVEHCRRLLDEAEKRLSRFLGSHASADPNDDIGP